MPVTPAPTPTQTPPPAPTGLARVTVVSAQRRVDVALPDGPPLAELLPELLAYAGVDLADDGEEHGGWLLRRGDGVALVEAESLAAQGVHDGALLHLGPARADWPELEYDDVVEAVAAGARRSGPAWTAAATRIAGLAVAGVVLAPGLVPGRLPAALTLGVAGLLLVAGILAARAYADAAIGTALGGYALPYAFAGGTALGGATGGGGAAGAAPGVLVGSVAVLLVSSVAAVGVGAGLRLFAAGITAGVLGAAGALVGFVATGAGAAAVVLAAIVTGAGALPLLAIRLGRLPTEAPADARVEERPVFDAVARTDALLTGMLIGLAPVGVTAAVVLARSGGPAGRALVAVAAVAVLLRARLFVTVAQRVPLLVTGVGALVPLAVAARSVPVMIGLALLGVGVAAAGGRYASRAPSPYLGRAADLLDALCVVSVIPIACAVLGLFARIRELVS